MPHNSLPRITIRVPEGLLEDVEAMVEAGEFVNRSDAIRTAMRQLVRECDDSDGEPSASAPSTPAFIPAGEGQ